MQQWQTDLIAVAGRKPRFPSTKSSALEERENKGKATSIRHNRGDTVFTEQAGIVSETDPFSWKGNVPRECVRPTIFRTTTFNYLATLVPFFLSSFFSCHRVESSRRYF